MSYDPDEPLSNRQEKAVGLIRLVELLEQKDWKASELQEELGLGERAIFNYLRDVERLSDILKFQFVHDKLRFTYRIEPKAQLGVMQSVVVHAALRMMAHHSPGYNKQYQEALRKLAQNLPEPLRKIALESTEALADRPASANGSNLERIVEAWLERKVIEFGYKIPGRAQPTRIELEVYFVEVSRANMAVYVIGRERLYTQAIKTYKLDRIDPVKVLAEAYDIPDWFDPRAYLSAAWGIVGGENPVAVKLRFAAEAAHRIHEGGYPNLNILKPEEGQLEDGCILVEISVGTDGDGFPLELLPWIQSWGPRVEVLEPQSLRQRWLEEARTLVETYGGGSGPPMTQPYWAHTHKDRSKWQTMKEHTTEVARLASEKAARFGEADKARLAGLLHDLGKYGDLFQQRLENPRVISGLDHWSAGAHVALFDYRAIEVALVIQGHHVGLQCGSKASLKEMQIKPDGKGLPPDLRLTETNLALLKQRLEADIGQLPPPATPVPKRNSAADMLDTRMLFSALVDADFLDTERTMNQGNPSFVPRPAAPGLQAAKALEHLDQRIAQLSAEQSIPLKTRELRRSLAEACAHAAGSPARTFTLTAPTGSGKTLSMLRFALKRAAQDPAVRRIVVVLPYLTILDQTLDIYRGLFGGFGEHYILEHHSLAGLREFDKAGDGVSQGERERRLLTENWDAPIVITTSVQLLESLHANRPGACRKLHNLIGSIVLFDEVQTLPTKLAVPTLKTLARLANDKYNCTVLFSTATQPAFDTLDALVRQGEPDTSGWQPTEIVTKQTELFSRAKRVDVKWQTQTPLPWAELVAGLRAQKQALCIVNLKRHAHALTKAAQLQGLGGIYHLSTALCPQHRRNLLARIVADLNADQACRVFATQCVEAGVDLDFPAVYRAMAPLDALAQAAGRCNRSDARPQKGTLTVFAPEEEKYPGKAYEQAAKLTKSLLLEHGGLDLDDPETYRRFYKNLYGVANTDDEGLKELIQTQNYEEFARRYRLIETGAVNVVVPYNAEAKALMQEARDLGISGDWMRRVRGYTVSHFLDRDGAPPYLEPLFFGFQQGERSEVPDWFLCGEETLYDPLLGFTPEEGGQQGAYFG